MVPIAYYLHGVISKLVSESKVMGKEDESVVLISSNKVVIPSLASKLQVVGEGLFVDVGNMSESNVQ